MDLEFPIYFSQELWLRSGEQFHIDDTGSEVALSDSPPTSQQMLVEKVNQFVQDIQKKGCFSYIKSCLKKLEGKRFCPAIFLNNLEKFLQMAEGLQAHPLNTDLKGEDKMDLDEESREDKMDVDGPDGPSLKKRPRSPSIEMHEERASKRRKIDRQRFQPVFSKGSKHILKDMSRELARQTFNLPHFLSHRLDYYQEGAPDMKFVIEYEGKTTIFPAHRSIVSTVRPWSSAFGSGMKETINSEYYLNDVDPEDFEKVLDWLYTGTLEWVAIPLPSDDKYLANDAIGHNISSLSRVARIADKFSIDGLSQYCKEKSSQLAKRLHCGVAATRAYLLQKSALHAFSNSESQVFNDVTFQLGDATFSGNKTLLSSRSLYFQALLKSSQNQPIRIDDAIPLEFFKEFVAQIHKGTFVSPLVFASTKNFSWEKWLTHENVWTFLKLAHQEGDMKNVAHCCELIVKEGLSSTMTDDQASFLDHLFIDDNSALPILTDRRLSLSNLTIKPSFNPESFLQLKEWIVENGSQLRSINLSHCKWVDDEFVLNIAKHCPHLQWLGLNGCTITDAPIMKLAENCPDLKVLGLTGCTKITDAPIIKLAESCPDLQVLGLGGCTKITDAPIMKLAEHCPHLQGLGLDGCTNITDAPIIKLAEICPDLRELWLDRCTKITDASIMKLAEHCPHLQELRLDRCTKITDASIMKLAELCPHLQVLMLNGCTNITDAPIIKLAEHCPHLQILGLIECTNITDAPIIKLAEHCPDLQELRLDRCTKITDAPIMKLAELCPHLQVLVLNGCTNITDAPIIKLAELCPHLQVLVLNGCTNITDAPIIKLAEHCPHLQVLVLTGCTKITDAPIIKLAEHCPDLQMLGLDGCSVTDVLIAQLRQRLPHCRIV